MPVLRLWIRPLRATPSIVSLLGVAALASILLTSCGGGGSSSGKQGSRGGPPQVASAESAQFCHGLGVNGCQGINTMIQTWLGNDHLSDTYAVGALYFAVSGCLNCHTYQKSGSEQLKAPDLSHIGGSLSEAEIVAVVRCPTCVHPGSKMPADRSLSKLTIHQMAAFLAASH
jgi:hypothetical protein